MKTVSIMPPTSKESRHLGCPQGFWNSLESSLVATDVMVWGGLDDSVNGECH